MRSMPSCSTETECSELWPPGNRSMTFPPASRKPSLTRCGATKKTSPIRLTVEIGAPGKQRAHVVSVANCAVDAGLQRTTRGRWIRCSTMASTPPVLDLRSRTRLFSGREKHKCAAERAAVREVIAKLPLRRREVLELMLDDMKKADVARHLNVFRARITQLASPAMDAIRQSVEQVRLNTSRSFRRETSPVVIGLLQVS